MLYAVSILSLLFAPEWQTYDVYTPQIEQCFVVDPSTQAIKYNHVSSLACFKGQWICAWNGNSIPAEGKPGQLNYMSTSDDGMHWTPPIPAFASAIHSHNPIPCPKGCQWQPNLLVVDGEMWAFWDHYSKDDYAGCYFSRLEQPGGKWRNRRLLWNGTVSSEEGAPKCSIEGRAFRPFPTQNACVLRSGRILQPVTLMGTKASDAPDALEGWWTYEKRSSVLYSDDRGATWHVSPGAIQPARSWAQWEPTVWEQPDGSVMMLARHNDPRTPEEGGPSPTQSLLWSCSKDAGETWSPHETVSLETVVSRPYVLPAGGDRFLMVHNDWHSGRFASDRTNLSLFFTRGPGFDFVAGPGITSREQSVAYPQACIQDDALFVSYTQGAALRGIKAARIAPLPNPNQYYLLPRTNRRGMGPPEQKDGAFNFQGQEYLETRESIELSGAAFTLAAMICTTERGVLLDARSEGGSFVWALASTDATGGGVIPFVHMGTPEGNVRSKLVVPFGVWTYCGVTVDCQEGRITFVVNEDSETCSITPIAKPVSRGTAYIGLKRTEKSSLTGFVGEMSAMALYKDLQFTCQEHAILASALPKNNASPSEVRDAPPSLWLTGRLPISEQAFTFRESKPTVRCVLSEEGLQVLEIIGDASAGVDLDQNDRNRGDIVHFAFRTRVDAASKSVICSVGDAEHPARIVIQDRKPALELDGKRYELETDEIRDADWFTLLIRSGNGVTSASVNDGPAREFPHTPQATWIYLGDGYPNSDADATGKVQVDVKSVRSRIETASS